VSAIVTPLLVFAAYYAWSQWQQGSMRDRTRWKSSVLGLLGLGLVVLAAVRSGQMLLAAVVGLVMLLLRLIPELGNQARSAERSEEARSRAEPGGGRANPEQMSRSQALEILGLQESATSDEITARYRSLIRAVHPDRGGSGYLAAQLNAARATLLHL
jgi:hypothetical protein